MNSSESYRSNTDDLSAVYVTNYGNLSLSNCSLYTTGNTSSQENSSFYGLNGGLVANNGSHVTMMGGSITTTGTGANAAIPTGSGTSISLSNVSISASGNGGHGVMATLGATLSLSYVSIVTSGTNAAPLATDRGGGIVQVTGGTVSSSGADSPGIYSTGTIMVTGGSVNADGSQACVIEGGNLASLTDSTLTGGVDDYGGVMIYQSTSGDADVGIGSFAMNGGSYTSNAGPAFFVTNTNATIYLTNVNTTINSGTLVRAAGTSRWGTVGNNGGNVILISENEHLNGSLTTDAISSITTHLLNSSVLTGSINTSSLRLSSDSYWNVSGTSNLTYLLDADCISDTSITNIIGNGFTVTYDPNLSTNSYLANKTYSLQNGGLLTPKGINSTDYFVINASAGSGGTISPSGLIQVTKGLNQTFNISSNLGMLIDDVTVDGESQGAVHSYTFPNVSSNHSINASFRVNYPSYFINATAGTGGNISPSGLVRVYKDNNQSFEITADTNYAIADILINNTTSLGPQDSPFVYTFNSVLANQTIVATFEEKSYYINASAGGGGSISPNGLIQVIKGSNQTFNISSNLGMLIDDVTVDGESQGAVHSYTFPNVTSNHSIYASFRVNYPSYFINATTGPGGNISPSGLVRVYKGNNQSFEITADTNYAIADILINNTTSLGPQDSPFVYIFNSVLANQTITATFEEEKSYFINASAGGGGSISPNGLIQVSKSSNQTFNISSNLGMLIDDVTVDGESQGAVHSYTFPDVTSNHSIYASFRVNYPSYIITATAGTGGSISPSGFVRVYKGNNQSFEITADTNYAIADILINNTTSLGPQDSPYVYTFNSVLANQTITATFTQVNIYINASANQWSNIIPRGNVTYPLNSNQTFITQAMPGSLLNDVLVNNTSVGVISSWTFTNLSEEQSIQTIGNPIPGQIQVFFNASPRYGPVPLTAQFNDNSIEFPTSWYWQFGDGQNSTEQDPSHTYTTAGSYTVSLRATNNQTGGVGTWNKFITVTDGVVPEPTPTPVPGEITADFTATPVSGTAPVSVQFTDQSTGNPVSWIWYFGDGSSSTLQNLSHSYGTSGTYSVTLVAQNEKYQGSITKSDIITIR
ncbi:MAG: PKD domain-containing protein [Methanospirillum sp.]|uniref:beta strand repeat-containing protein n=1 Tax=Methanospirillum sp. TaxID=45200 RepID=UPI00237060A4|nr:PKD domain-containing protein [Methanospirillum sp.]MDD1729308.1 PKD domain-containing protein [Methanospirillum sp.]